MTHFSLQAVLSNLQKCLADDHGMSIDPYLAAYKELNKFFQGLGSIFNFISSDVSTKIAIMDAYRADASVARNYADLQSMVDFERETGALGNTSKPSGSRTLLRLHWALEFISHFFKALSTASDSTRIGTLAQDSYQKTLAKHHPWYIRQGASLALITLPTCKQMFSKAHPDEKDRMPELLRSVAEEVQRVFDFTEEVYAENNLLELP